MDTTNLFSSRKSKDRSTLLALCLLLSISLHLLIVFSLPYEKLNKDNLAIKQQKPTIVRLVDKPVKDEKKEYELDQRPTQPSPEPPPKSSRLAEQNQRVEKETAPKGDDVRDQSAKQATRQSRPAPPSANRQQLKQPAPSATPAVKKQRPIKKALRLPTKSNPQLPPLEQLTQLSPDTLNRINNTEKAAQERIKQRDDLETGDTVWLNLQRGDLISFFRRFHNQVELVWNYPQRAIENEIQGVLLLKVTIEPTGELKDVELIRSSGYEILDSTAIRAIFTAGPFGPLPRQYPYPDLKFYANFSYTLSGQFIYGKRR